MSSLVSRPQNSLTVPKILLTRDDRVKRTLPKAFIQTLQQRHILISTTSVAGCSHLLQHVNCLEATCTILLMDDP